MKRLHLLLGSALLLTPFTPACAQTGTADRKDAAFDAQHLAAIATALVDGDTCKQIVTERALRYLSHADPRDPWADADNYDVDAAAFQQIKNTLLRIAMLGNDHTALNLWMPVSTRPGSVQVVIRLRPSVSGFLEGTMTQNMPGPMQQVFETGRQSMVLRQKGTAVILAPVQDSLGHTVAVVEVAERLGADPGTKGDTE